MFCRCFVRGKAIYMGQVNHMARRLSLCGEPGMEIERKEGAQRPVTFFGECEPFLDSLSLLIFSVQ